MLEGIVQGEAEYNLLHYKSYLSQIPQPRYTHYM